MRTHGDSKNNKSSEIIKKKHYNSKISLKSGTDFSRVSNFTLNRYRFF